MIAPTMLSRRMMAPRSALSVNAEPESSRPWKPPGGPRPEVVRGRPRQLDVRSTGFSWPVPAAPSPPDAGAEGRVLLEERQARAAGRRVALVAAGAADAGTPVGAQVVPPRAGMAHTVARQIQSEARTGLFRPRGVALHPPGRGRLDIEHRQRFLRRPPDGLRVHADLWAGAPSREGDGGPVDAGRADHGRQAGTRFGARLRALAEHRKSLRAARVTA
jgi:hypothetical protein